MTSQEPQEEVDPEDSGNRSEKSHMGISEIPDLWGPCIQVCGSCGFKSALSRGSPAQHQTCHCFFFVKTVQRPQGIWQDTNFADLLSFISTCLSARTWSEVLLPCPSSLLLSYSLQNLQETKCTEMLGQWLNALQVLNIHPGPMQSLFYRQCQDIKELPSLCLPFPTRGRQRFPQRVST